MLCRLTLELGGERARLYARALGPDAGASGRGAQVRIRCRGRRLHLEIESDSLSHARAALSTHAGLVRLLNRLVDASGDSLLHTR